MRRSFCRFLYAYVLLLGFTVLLTSCVSGKIFTAVDDKSMQKMDGIAVISATSDEPDISFAKIFTKTLKEKTSIRVIEQDEISKRIPQYPFDVLESSSSTTDRWSNAPEQLDARDMSRVSMIRSRLNANILLVVWLKRFGGSTSCLPFATHFYVSVCVRLIKFPPGKVVGYSEFDVKSTTLQSSGSAFDGMLETASESIIVEINKIVKIMK